MAVSDSKVEEPEYFLPDRKLILEAISQSVKNHGRAITITSSDPRKTLAYLKQLYPNLLDGCKVLIESTQERDKIITRVELKCLSGFFIIIVEQSKLD